MFQRKLNPWQPIRICLVSAALLLAAGAGAAVAQENPDATAAAAAGPSSAEIAALVEQLNADDAADRDAAEKKLVELGLAGDAAAGDTFLDQLPEPNDRMPQEVQTRLARVTGEIRQRLARQGAEETRVTLDVADAPLSEVLASLEKQTGNRLADNREQFGQEIVEKRVTVKAADEPFWAVLDKVLDSAQMSPYSFSGEEGLALVNREPGALRRAGRAVYSGPFRIEATSIRATRGLRSPDQSGLDLDIEIAWEPRLRPIALTQPVGELKAVADDGRNVPPTSPEAVFDVEIEPGAHATEVTLPLQLPGRSSKTLQSVACRMTALVPGRMVDMKFDNLADAKEVSQEAGGVTVTLDRVVKNQAIWELYMRVRIDSLSTGVESHRSWVFQNVTFLVDGQGEQLDNAGFETTLQNEAEAGFAYFFELPEGRDIGDYQWVYRTPASIMTLPVEFTLEEVPLP